MRLRLLYPEIESRDCELCQQYSWNEETGTVNLFRGAPRLRIIGVEKTPCRTEHGCPKGTPEKPLSLSPRNLLFYQRYKEWRVTGRWPDDRLVWHLATLVSEVERQCLEAKSNALAPMSTTAS